MKTPSVSRRGILAAGLTAAAMPAAVAATPEAARCALSTATFGATGDGTTDDTSALQSALDTAFASDGAMLTIPPGNYRITRTLRISPKDNVTRHCGILAHGARLASAIADGGNVLEIVCRSTARFLLIEGLDILGSGREGHGLVLQCDSRDNYLYNFCLRDLVVQDCRGDGLSMSGNVFEGQIINSYFRKNGGNGATFAHGAHGGILSAIHVFGSVFGDNGRDGAALQNGCYDVAFHGCYFLLNGKNGLHAENGCTLATNCGFENNHQLASGFTADNAGIELQGFGTLVGCTAYSVFNQGRLINAFLTGRLVMNGCSGSGGQQARRAGLARLGGTRSGSAVIIGSSGAIEYVGDFEGLELGGQNSGIRFGARWQSRNLAQLGDYRLWVDARGRLRLKKGVPAGDEDGTPVGA